jgi:hypothetical protein
MLIDGRKVIEFSMIEEINHEKFVAEVNKHIIDDSWELYGQPFSAPCSDGSEDYHYIYQALVLFDD